MAGGVHSLRRTRWPVVLIRQWGEDGENISRSWVLVHQLRLQRTREVGAEEGATARPSSHLVPNVIRLELIILGVQWNKMDAGGRGRSRNIVDVPLLLSSSSDE